MAYFDPAGISLLFLVGVAVLFSTMALVLFLFVGLVELTSSRDADVQRQTEEHRSAAELHNLAQNAWHEQRGRYTEKPKPDVWPPNP